MIFSSCSGTISGLLAFYINSINNREDYLTPSDNYIEIYTNKGN